MPVSDDGWALGPWREVLARVPDPHPFATPEWQRAWWEHFGAGRLSVVPLAVDAETVAVAPVVCDGKQVVRFLGGEDVTDYPGPAMVPGSADATAEGLLGWLLRSGWAWRELDVRNARPQDGLAVQLAVAADQAGLPSHSSDDEPVAILTLPPTWDEYLASLSRHSRRELRRKQNRLFRELPGAALRTASDTTVMADLESFFALHRRARGAKGAFMSAPRQRFFRRIAADFIVSGTLRLDVLRDGDRPLAATVGFQSARVFYLYNMAFEPTASSLAPGIVLLSLLLQRAITDRLERFDFLRGLERYKLDLGAVPTYLQRVRVSAR